MRYVRVENHNDLVRDTKTGAILMTDSETVRRNRALKEKRKQEKQELEQLKSDVQEIKDILKSLHQRIEADG